MRNIGWTILIAVAIVVVGVFSGIAGLLLWPLVGAVVLVGLIIWFMKRGAEGKPPIK